MKKIQSISLIELISALAILAILMGISYSNYSTIKMANRRKDAQTELLKLKSNLEKMALSETGVSVIDLAKRYETITSTNPIVTFNRYYSIKVTNVSDGSSAGTLPGYTLIARPLSDGPQARDIECAEISLIIIAGREDIKNPDDNDRSRSCWR